MFFKVRFWYLNRIYLKKTNREDLLKLLSLTVNFIRQRKNIKAEQLNSIYITSKFANVKELIDRCEEARASIVSQTFPKDKSLKDKKKKTLEVYLTTENNHIILLKSAIENLYNCYYFYMLSYSESTLTGTQIRYYKRKYTNIEEEIYLFIFAVWSLEN